MLNNSNTKLNFIKHRHTTNTNYLMASNLIAHNRSECIIYKRRSGIRDNDNTLNYKKKSQNRSYIVLMTNEK